jgi:hypothetical protein
VCAAGDAEREQLSMVENCIVLTLYVHSICEVYHGFYCFSISSEITAFFGIHLFIREYKNKKHDKIVRNHTLIKMLIKQTWHGQLLALQPLFLS